ncbi:MAG: double-strand break repair protein AddB [Kordiimonas sp.]
MADPCLYSIDPSVSFVDALAEGLLAMAGNDPLALSEMTVLLPNRRAQRSLQEAFLRILEHKTTLLPVMRPIGDVDEDEVSFLGAGLNIDPSDLLPAITPARRQALLMQQVMAWGGLGRAFGGTTLAPAQGWRLSTELARLMDQVDTEGLDYAELVNLVPAELAHHWDVTLNFLKIVTQTWPLILEAEGAQNPVARRDKMLSMLAEAWSSKPPEGKIIAAGSTGSVPATAHLLSTVARLPGGMVVLPGFDLTVTDSCWELIDPTHPQTAMKSLLDTMGVSRHEVAPWPYGTRKTTERYNYIKAALLPSALTRTWREQPYSQMPDAQLFDGMRAITAPTRREEADAVASLMRETLETPGKTAALVTPDRQLARYVRASLGRWHIDIDDSGGDRALNTVPGRLLGLIATAVADNFSPVPLLSLLQHPMVALGTERPEYLEFARLLDQEVLRGVRPAGGLDGLLARATEIAADSKAKFSETELCILQKAIMTLQPLCVAFEGGTTLDEVLRIHIECAEALSATEEKTGAETLWAGEAGHALAEGLSELIEETGPLTGIAAEGYGALFAEMLAPIMVRPVWRRHPRLSIWGPLEARLQRADVMILGGLNEGVWPGDIKSDPWMSKPMRAAFGLPPLERRTGQSAHDFVQAASGGTVFLTRAEKVDGSPTVPSRWWFRLEALAGRPIPAANEYLDYANALSAAKKEPQLAPPAPKPPVAARPKKLSVTQVETWMRDPYALYAKKILGLRVLDPIDDRPNAAKKGTLLHKALELFLSEKGPKYEEEGLKRLLAVGRRVFEPVINQPAVYAFWWPRFEHIAEWFVANEKKRSERYEVAAVEQKGTVTLAGTDFSLFAIADRIDKRLEDGSYEIIDYKTGNVPTAKRVAAGFAPQLPLEAWLLEHGGFTPLSGEVQDLIFWELKGGDPVERQVRPVKDIKHTVEVADAGLRKLVDEFSNVNTPYLSNPKPSEAGYGDYDHLARVKEWRGGADPFDEGTEA